MAKDDNLLKQIEAKLKKLRQYFFENVDAVGPFAFSKEEPNMEYDNGAPVFRTVRGTLTVIQSRKPIMCDFKGEEQSDSRHGGLEGFKKYFGFSDFWGLWSYDDGTCLGNEHFDNPAHWLVSAEVAVKLEEICQAIEKLVFTLTDNKYQTISAQTSKAIRSGNPQWVQNKVQWTYIKDLDSAIKAVADFQQGWTIETLDKKDETEEPSIYIELDLAERKLIIGADQYMISSEKVWDFLKELATKKKSGRLTSRLEWKNQVDMLRRQIKKDNLRKVIKFTNGGYLLQPYVEVKYGSQIGIRRTR